MPDRPDLTTLPIFDTPPAKHAPPPPSTTPATGGPTMRSVTLPEDHPFFTGTPGRQPAPASRPAPDVIDWTLVRLLRQQAAEQLSLELRQTMTEAEFRATGQRIVLDLLKGHAATAISNGEDVFDPTHQRHLHKAVMDSLFGLGRLQPLLDDDQIENIEFVGCDDVVVEYFGGRLERAAPIADSDQELIEQLEFIASRQRTSPRPFNTSDWSLNLRLDDGSRLAASAWVSMRPQGVIRRHRLTNITLDDLVALQLMDHGIANFLAAAVASGKSIMVSGPQGCGKTTLLRAMATHVSPWEKVGTVETEFELHLNESQHFHGKRTPFTWETRPGFGDPIDGKQAGEVTIDELVYTSWRYNLARLFVGEVRGKEVDAMLHAMAGGAGSMSSIHARSARDCIERLTTMLMQGNNSYEAARRRIAQHLDYIVQIKAPVIANRRHRFISEVVAVLPGEDTHLATNTVYDHGRHDHPAQPVHLPHHDLDDLIDAGFDPIPFGRGALQ